MQLSVITAKPWPFTSIQPPSNTQSVLSKGTPASLATKAATLASCRDACLPPQPLKLKFTPARSPAAFFTNTQLVSRIHKSSSPAGIRRTLSLTSLRAMASSSARTNMCTGSNSAMVLAIKARLRRTSGSSLRPQIFCEAPNAIQVRTCGASSSGINQPEGFACAPPAPDAAPAAGCAEHAPAPNIRPPPNSMLWQRKRRRLIFMIGISFKLSSMKERFHDLGFRQPKNSAWHR